MPKRKFVTIRDVARVAGVSPTTVSRFTNGTLSLPEETATRIRDAIRDLNYRPNVLAQNLSLGQSHTLGLVVPDIANPFFAQLASAAEREAFFHGYHLLLCSSESDPERELTYLKELQAKRIDGIIFLTEHPDREHLVDSITATTNIVLVDEDVPDCEVGKVFSDNQHGGYLATQYLLDLGHKRIAHVGGMPKLMTAKERFEGYKKALQDYNIPFRQELLYNGLYRQSTGRLGLRALLELSDPPTAIFAASDYTAIGILREARELGIQIPKDLSLVGFDGIAVGEMLSPALTTVAQPIEELGEQGVRVLLEILSDEPQPVRTDRLSVALVTRESAVSVNELA